MTIIMYSFHRRAGRTGPDRIGPDTAGIHGRGLCIWLTLPNELHSFESLVTSIFLHIIYFLLTMRHFYRKATCCMREWLYPLGFNVKCMLRGADVCFVVRICHFASVQRKRCELRRFFGWLLDKLWRMCYGQITKKLNILTIFSCPRFARKTES